MNALAVLRLSALGDVAMTVPLINALKTAYPQAKIYWIIARPFDQLVNAIPGVELIVIDKPHGPLDFYKLYQQLNPYNFDVLLAPQASMRANLICWMVKAKRKIGYASLHARDGQRWFVHETVPAHKEHLIDSFLQFARYLGVTIDTLDWQLALTPADQQWAQAKLQDAKGIKLALNLAASKPERNWPLDRYVAVMRELKQRWYITPILVGGPGQEERVLAELFYAQCADPVINLVGRSSFKQLAAVLGLADVLLAPDSGPLHIAQAMRTPVVGLYAVAPPEKTGPYFCMPWVVNRFPQAVKTILHKDPASISWRQRVHDPRAMRLIQVDDVVRMVERLFNEQNFRNI